MTPESLSTGSDHASLQELDLIILNMEGQADEQKVQQILQKARGIDAARLIQEGVWIRYNPELTTKEKLCGLLTDAGYPTTLFQDSLSGETGDVSQA